VFLKERLAAGGDVLNGVLCAIPSAVAGQAIAAAGADFLVVDREHGPVGREAMQAMIAATAGTGCAPLVRVPGIDAAEAKVALDAGAEGLFFPMVRSAADVERCVAAVTYPPAGARGWGPFVAHARHGVSPGAYSGAVGPHMTCCVQIETLEAVKDIDAIAAVPGVDLVMIAPFDLSCALGIEGRFDDPRFVEAEAAVERAVLGAGVPLCGVALTAERAAELAGRGYRALLRGIDVFLLAEAVAAFRLAEGAG
jgi:4-hydroxy-2-oxoheptanedioate aldolase